MVPIKPKIQVSIVANFEGLEIPASGVFKLGGEGKAGDYKIDKDKSIEKEIKAVPAGSVYYFELLNGAMEDVNEVFHQAAISDMYLEQGFGISYVGKVEEHEL
jgi:hypothetical protein